MILEVFLVIAGVYLLYMGIKMAATHDIPAGMVSNKVKLDRAKDKEGYIKFMIVRTLICAVLMTVSSLILLIGNNIYPLNSLLVLAAELIFIGVVIYYSVITIKATNRFLF